MALHDLGLTFLALISEIIGTVSGFGSSTFFVPSAMFIESFQFVLALTAILHVISNSSKLFLFRGNVPIKDCLPLAAPFIAFTAIGATLTSILPITALRICLGAVLMVIAITHFTLTYTVTRPIAMVMTAISGFFTGLVGTGGAVRGAALRSMKLEKNAFVFASSFIDFGGDAARAGIYIHSGYMDWNQWYYLPLLISVAILGSWCGKRILAKINQATFERIVTTFIFISGATLIFEGS